MPAYAKPKVKTYVRPVPGNWWLKRPAHTWYMLRELSGAVLGVYALLLLRLMHRAGGTPANFEDFLDTFRNPLSLLFHVVVLAFALLNTLTTFNLAPRMFKLRKGEERVPDATISGIHYALWAVVSVILFFVATRG